MKAVLYFKYLLSENVSLLILWNSVKQLQGFLSQGYHQPTKEHLYFFLLDSDAAESICNDTCQSVDHGYGENCGLSSQYSAY